MTRLCQKCSRINPPDAAFCHHDGASLNGTQGAANGASIDFSTWTFPSPFVFPNGEACRNFIQLALACNRDLKVSTEILQQGFLESFFASLGRLDLALAAKVAAKSPDLERGLSELLGKLPGSPLAPAQLQVDPTQKNFGVVQVGEDRTFELSLTNKGDLLVCGKVLIDGCPWLALGDAGTTEKLFQFTQKSSLPVHIRGKWLRAFGEPLKAEIVVESNGGNQTIPIQVSVPVKPFPEGILSGVRTPRQLAEKAKANVAAAAALIESGTVARWYESNGWTYPVQGPAASGLAAVQQLFEALGLVRSPKVDLSESTVTLRGNPGERLEYPLTVQTLEKRAAVAHGVSNQPWLTVGRTVFRGQTAQVPLVVEAIPDEPGQTLEAGVKVIANGNQRFDVRVNLVVNGIPRPPVVAMQGPPPLPTSPPPPVPVSAFTPQLSPIPPPSPVVSVPPMPVVSVPPPQPFSSLPPLVFSAPLPPPATHEIEQNFADLVPHRTPPPAPVPRAPAVPRRQLLFRLLPVGIVVVGLLAAVSRDLLFHEPPDVPLPEVDYANPRLAVRFHEAILPDEFVSSPSMRFGLGLPDPADPKKFKTKLIFDEHGRTCNVVVRVDRVDYLWGIEQGAWRGPILQPLGKDKEGRQLIGAKAVWARSGAPSITVTQYVEIVPGGLSPDGKKRLLDTCKVYYDITNEDGIAHQVGLRFLLDTYIGSNDAVPFLVAGSKELCDTMKTFDKAADVPDFISALERQDLKNPGTVAHLILKYGASLEPPTRVTLGAWPAGILRNVPGGAGALMQNTRWDVPVLPMALAKDASNPNGDSAVTLYWDDKDIPPKQTRTVGFAYGLGSVTGEKGDGQLAMTAGGEVKEGKEFTLTAYVKNPAPGTTITLTLPSNLKLVGGSEKENVPPIPPGASSAFSPVSWRVKATKSAIVPVVVKLSSGATLRHRLAIRGAGVLD
jgi:hypothetical protein